MVKKKLIATAILGLALTASVAAQPSDPPPTQEATPAPPALEKAPAPKPKRAVSPFGGPIFQGDYGTGKDDGFGLGSALPDPTAFDGAIRHETVLSGSRFMDTSSYTGHYGHYFSPSQRLMVTAGAGSNSYALDVDYSFLKEGIPGYFSAYVNQTHSLSSSFVEGEVATGLPGANDLPWLYRTSVGFGYTTNPADPLIFSTALVYQRVGIHSGPLTSRVAPIDSLGNPLLVSASGIDDIFTVRLAGRYLDLDDNVFPKDGSKVGFFFDQAIPIGSAQIDSTRLGFNFSHFFALSDDDTLIFQLQSATSFGRVAPYEAFNLGGLNSVRGYQFGELGGGRSFVQSTLEMRHTFTHLHLFGSDIPLRVVGFADYGSGLGSAGQVYGTPALVRGKRDRGFGFGAGVQAETNFGLIRLEAGLAPNEKPVLYLNLGDRF